MLITNGGRAFFPVQPLQKQSGANTGCTTALGDLGEENLSRVCYAHDSQRSRTTVGTKKQSEEQQRWKRSEQEAETVFTVSGD